MKLAEIIENNKIATRSIEIQALQPYFKSLYAYYSNYFYGEPVLMVTDVFNACQYAKIVDSSEFNEAVCEYIKSECIENESNEDKICQYETINFNSKMLKDFIN